MLLVAGFDNIILSTGPILPTAIGGGAPSIDKQIPKDTHLKLNRQLLGGDDGDETESEG